MVAQGRFREDLYFRLNGMILTLPPPRERGDRAWLIETLLAALRRHRWVVTAAARELGVCRATVYRRMEKLGIVPPNALDI